MTIFARAFLTFFVIFLSSAPLYAQGGARAQGYLDCDDARVQPLNEFERLNRIYIQNSAGNPDCIYHERADGKVGIFMPESWSSPEFISPYLGLSSPEALLETTLRVTQDAFDAYRELEGDMESKIHILFTRADTDFLFNDVSDGIYSETLMETLNFDSGCYIAVRPFDDWVSENPGVDQKDVFAFTLAHELAHCYIFDKLGPTLPTEVESDLDYSWWEEAACELMAVEVVPNRAILDWTTVGYDVIGEDFRQPYFNAWLFSDLAGRRGSSLLYDFDTAPESLFQRIWMHIRYFSQTDSKATAYRLLRELGYSKDALAGTPGSAYNNELQMYLTEFAFPRSGRTNGRCNFGADCTYQREPSVGYSRAPITISGDAWTLGSISFDSVPGGRAYRARVTVAPNRSAVIQAGAPAFYSSEPSLSIDVIWSNPYERAPLKSGVFNVGDCGRARGSFDLVVTHLSPDPVTDLQIFFEIQPCPAVVAE